MGYPFRERRSLLRTHFPPYTPPSKGAARFDHVKSVESESGREAVEEFWQEAVNSSCEGLMVKVCSLHSGLLLVPSVRVFLPLIAGHTLQLLDSGEILEEPNQRKDNPRRKPLPATYEPGACKCLSHVCRRGHECTRRERMCVLRVFVHGVDFSTAQSPRLVSPSFDSCLPA